MSVPTQMLQRFRDEAKRQQISHVDLLLDAIEAAGPRLGELIRASRPEEDRGGLFVRTVTADSAPLSTLALRMQQQNVDAIDRLVRETHATSRSQLCVAALSHYLK
ncbi:hypothetical protein [Rudaeicoccus suwonensis]|nr:hypothetical protein [Rudaeicoccus suwonensis]